MAESEDDSTQEGAPPVLGERINGLLRTSPEIRSLAALSRRTGVDRAALSQKIHGRRRWYLDEVIRTASALETTVAYLIGETDSASAPGAVFATPEDPDVLGLFVTLDGEEVARRLRYLQEISHATAIDTIPPEHPLHDEPQQLEALLRLTSTVRISRQLLQELAVFFRVPADYLLVLDHPDDAERVEAEVEFEAVIRESGVKRVAARSLGSLSAAEIRALTAALRR